MTSSAEVAGAEGADWRLVRRYQPDDPADRTVLDDLDRQLSGLRFIDTPVWAFDAERCQCLWANPTGLEIWKAASLTELQQRDIASTQSEAVYTLHNDYLRRVAAGESIAVWVTLDPRGTTRRFYQSHHLLTPRDSAHRGAGRAAGRRTAGLCRQLCADHRPVRAGRAAGQRQPGLPPARRVPSAG